MIEYIVDILEEFEFELMHHYTDTNIFWFLHNRNNINVVIYKEMEYISIYKNIFDKNKKDKSEMIIPSTIFSLLLTADVHRLNSIPFCLFSREKLITTIILL